MTKFTRTANKNDLYEGAVLLYGDQQIFVDFPMGGGVFSVGLPGGQLGELHPSKIQHFQVEIKPLKAVK
jgi:hypothetical protein